jgi:endonuclease-3
MRAGEAKRAQAKGKRAPGSRLTQEQVDEIFHRFQAEDPHPKTELHYHDPFTLLVAVVLSAQATDASVNRATPALFRIAGTPDKMIALGEAGLIEKIKTIGLYRAKARNLIALSKALIEEHGGKVPDTREVLESLPGVGRKTANVVLNVAFGAKTIAIDTHAFRVANRTGLAPGKTPLKVEETLNRIVPDRYKHNAHHWLILHGRYICKARKPECWRCLIADICRFKPKTLAPAAG